MSDWNINKVVNDKKTDAEKGLIVASAWLAGQSKRLTPTITSRLKNSISWAVKGGSAQDMNKDGGTKANSNEGVKSPSQELKAYIGTSVSYAPYVEFGTSSQMEQPFLRFALYTNKSKIQQIFAKVMRK